MKTAIFHQLTSSQEETVQKVLRTMNMEDGKTAKIYIFAYKNTVDEDWVKKALSMFDKNKIKWINC